MNSLPIQDIARGGFNEGSIPGSAVIAPFVTIINTIVAILAAIFLAWAVFSLVVKTKDLITGKRDFRSMTNDFVSIGVGILVLVMCMTGSWYPLINWFYVNVIVKILGAFK